MSSVSDLGAFGQWAAGFGVLTSAVGSYYSVAGQKVALSAQAQLDYINVRSSALAMTGNADLSMISAKSQASSSVFGAQMAQIGAEQSAMEMKAGAAISAARAGGQIASLEAGAEVDDLSAQLAELQAQSSLLHGEWKEQDTRLQAAQAKSKATASMGARGLAMDEGTPMAVRAGYQVMAERAAIQIQQETLMQAFSYRTNERQAQISAAGKRAQAGAIASASSIESALADAKAGFVKTNAAAMLDYTKAMARVGLLTAQAQADYSKGMAGIMVDNAAAARDVRLTQTDALSPTLSAVNTALTGFGQVASGWYRLLKPDGLVPGQTTGKF